MKILNSVISLLFAFLLERSLAYVVQRVGQQSTVSASARNLVVLNKDKNNNAGGGGSGGGFFKAVSDFFQELDAFVDDATARRLGNGAVFYGKRRSNFYGPNDKYKKTDRDTPDPTEDYQGPTNTGLFMWMQDEETGQLKPVTRMKQRVVERNPNFWDRYYSSEDETK
ncbi:hypothetical protein ACA910_001712 [Epithemia clementina (nom. ined.)]